MGKELRKEIVDKIIASNESNQLILSEMEITDAEVSEIMSKIKSDLDCIMLNNNKITDSGAFIIEQKCKDLKNLTYLDLQFNQLGRDGIAVMERLKLYLPNATIGLNGNNVSNTGEAEQIKESVKRHSPF